MKVQRRSALSAAMKSGIVKKTWQFSVASTLAITGAGFGGVFGGLVGGRKEK